MDADSNISSPFQRAGAIRSSFERVGLARKVDLLVVYNPSSTVRTLLRCYQACQWKEVTLNHTIRLLYENLVSLQGIEKHLNKNCTCFYKDLKLCFFPQYVLRFITIPFFIINTAYDEYQFNHILVPLSADMPGSWKNCKINTTDCSETQI